MMHGVYLEYREALAAGKPVKLGEAAEEEEPEEETESEVTKKGVCSYKYCAPPKRLLINRFEQLDFAKIY